MTELQLGLGYVVLEWIIRLVMLAYVPQKRSAAAARTWLLLIFLLPIPGLIVYLFIGRVYLPRWRLERQQRASELIREAVQTTGGPFGEVPPTLRDVARMVQTLGEFPPRPGNIVELLNDYQGSIDRLIADIDQARSSIHLLFYIFWPDRTGTAVTEALLRARQRNVVCRVMMDDIGSRSGLRRLAPRLREAGVDVRPCLPTDPLRRLRGGARFDLRNHRKIAVLDGTVGWTGSQNIVDPEFVKGYPNEELVARVTGPVVRQLQAVFLEDWFFETGDVLRSDELLPAPRYDGGPDVCQVLPSGPGYPRKNAHEMLVHLMHEAEQYIGIATPYFVPDESFLNALTNAVTRGVATHLIVSNPTDGWLTAAAQCSYFEDLLEAGVRIHLYRPHFLHAKHLVIDQHVAVIGSVNMDIRSFALNEEVALLVYGPAVVGRMRDLQQRCIADSFTLDAAQWAARPRLQRILQNTARLADTLL